MTIAKLLRTLMLLLVPMGLMFSAPAQAQTTGTIKGQVVDDGGLAVPGVLMTIESAALIGGVQQQSSDDKGRFGFNLLPPGIYSLTAEKPGFSTKSYPSLQVLIGRNVILTVEMEVMVAGAEIIVSEDRPAIDTEKASVSTVMTKDFLQRVPTGRSYQSAVSMTPGVLPGGNPNMGGAAYNENTYMIDGVNVTDAVTGTFSLNFNFDAIQELEVITAAFDAEYPSNLGGIINIVTDTGSNTLEFDTSVYYNNANWSPKADARFAADGAELNFSGFDSNAQSMEVNARISGPILRDKVWFIVSYSMQRSLFANVGIDLPRDFEGHYFYSKITAQPTSAHRVTLLMQSDPTTIDNTDQGDRFTRPEAQSRQAQGGWLASLQWDWFPTPDIIVESKATVQQNYIESYGVPCTHNKRLGYNPCQPDELENTIDFQTPGRTGVNNAFNSDNAVTYYFDDRDRYRAETKVSLLQQQIPVLVGNHDFKTGFEVDVLRQDQVQGVTGDIYFTDLNQVAFDPETYQNYYWVEYSGAYDTLVTGEHYGAFIQDVYKPINNLTFRYGLRYDHSVMRTNLQEATVNFGVWGPRFYVVWDPWADEKTKIRGGYGRFNGIGNLGVNFRLNSSPGFGSKLFLGEYFGNYTNESVENYSLNAPETTETAHDRITAPHSDEFSMGAERQIIQDLVVAVGFVGKFTRNIYAFDETNVIWDEDGYNYIGTSNGQVEDINRLRTPTVSRRDYYQTDISLIRREADRWAAQATYSYTVSRGTILNSASNSRGLTVPPQATFGYGNLGTDVRHQVKGAAYWDIPNDPWTTTIGASLEYYSGYPVSRYYYSAGYGSNFLLKQPLGSYARLTPWYTVGLQVSQAIKVPKGEFKVVGTLQNATNFQGPINASGGYINSQNRFVVASRPLPIEGSLGLRYIF